MTIAEQLKGIERIIALHDLSHKADKYFRLAGHEIDCMRAVAETLRTLLDEQTRNEKLTRDLPRA